MRLAMDSARRTLARRTAVTLVLACLSATPGCARLRGLRGAGSDTPAFGTKVASKLDHPPANDLYTESLSRKSGGQDTALASKPKEPSVDLLAIEPAPVSAESENLPASNSTNPLPTVALE